jgi:hypothetical protein
MSPFSSKHFAQILYGIGSRRCGFWIYLSVENSTLDTQEPAPIEACEAETVENSTPQADFKFAFIENLRPDIDEMSFARIDKLLAAMYPVILHRPISSTSGVGPVAFRSHHIP